MAAFRPVFSPGAVDPLCCGLRPRGAVGLGIGVGALRPQSIRRPQASPLRVHPERWPRLRTVLLAGLLTAVLCLPGLPVALRQIPSYRNPNLVVPPVGGYLAELARVYGLGEHLDAAAAQPWVWGLAGWLVIGWVLGLVMRRRGDAETGGRGERLPHTRTTQYAIRTYALRPRLGHPAYHHLLPGHPRPGDLRHALHQLCAAGLAAAGRTGAARLGAFGTLGRRAGCGCADRDPDAGVAR